MVYRVDYQNKDYDYIIDSYWLFENFKKAKERASQIKNGHVKEDDLWVDKYDNFYKVELEEVEVK